jgi:hypothetical protein
LLLHFEANQVISWSGSNYVPFQKNTQIIDVLVDYVNDQMWYRVAGGAWQG